MKKTLIAMAVLAAASTASAQSSVTLYGVLDLGLSTSSTRNTVDANAAPDRITATNLFGNQGSTAASRLGVRGTEDLGGGTSAFFTYEFGLSTDSGAALGTTRLAHIGMQGGFGRVSIGTQNNALDAARSAGNAGSSNFADEFSEGYDTPVPNFNLFAATGFPTGFTEEAAGHIGGTSSNSLQYSSPTVAGVTAVLTLASNNTRNTSAAGIVGNTRNTQAILGLQYEGHGLSAHIAYGNARTENPAVAAVVQTFDNAAGVTVLGKAAVAAKRVNANDFILAAGYKFNLGSAASATPSLIYEASRGRDSVSGLDNVRSYFGIGSKFEIGAFQPWINFGFGRLRSNVQANNVRVRETGIEVGTYYVMSPRTSAYAFYNAARERVSSNGIRAGRVTRNNLSIGLKHSF